MKVAVPVEIATGRNVLTLISGSISSVANSTPPIGVLNVEAMPAPAPAGDQDDALAHGHADHLPEGRTERGADLDDRTFATNRCTAADRQRGCERLGHRDHGADDAAL